MTDNWYARTPCKIHFDMHTPESVHDVGRDFTPQTFAKAISETGADAVCFFARCAYGWSYYPTNVGLPHPHLARDLFGDGVAALKAEGIRVIAYCAIDNAPAVLAADHPHWVKRSADGEPLPGHGSAASCCGLGPFPHELLIPQFCEIAERYPVDGFFLDGVYQYFNKVCHCEHCRTNFGQDIPQTDHAPNWRAYWHWQVQRVWEALGLAAEKVAEIRPGCLMGVNWMSAIRWSVPPPDSMGYLTGDPPMQNCTFDTALNLAAWSWRDKPADVMTQRMLHSWQDFTCRTPETLETEFATGLAAGGMLFVGDLLPPTIVQPDAEVAKLLHHCFSFAKLRQDLTIDARRRSDIAILSSPEAIRSQGSRWAVDDTALRGAYHAITASGLTADILYDEDLECHLSRYQTLVIPEQQFVSRSAGRAVEQFVRRGGALVLTGALPKCVDPEEPDASADPSVFETLAGATSDGLHPFDLSYLQLRGTPGEGLWREDDSFLPAIPVHGAPAQVIAGEAEILAHVVAPGQTYQIGARPPGEATESPALTLHHIGQGEVFFCALPLAGEVWRRGNPGARYVLAQMARRVTPTPSVERIGPSSVQIYHSERDHQTLVHLVAYQPDGRTAMSHIIESPSAMTGVQVRLLDPRQPKWIHMEPDGAIPVLKYIEGGVLIEAPTFVTHTAISIEWADEK